MSNLITELHLLSKDEQKYKVALRYKDGKVSCIIDKDGADKPFIISGPVQAVSDQIFERFQKFLQVIDADEATEEVQDNTEDTEEEIKDEEVKEAEAAARKTVKTKSKTIKEEPKKPEPSVRTVMEIAMEKLDKGTKASVTKVLDRMRKPINDPDVKKFLLNSLTNTLKTALNDDELVDKVLEEVQAAYNTLEKKPEEKEKPDTLFSGDAPTAAVVTPEPPVIQAPVTQAPPAQPAVSIPAPVPVVTAGSFDMEETELF